MVVLFYSSAHHSQLCLAKMQPTFVKPLLLKHQCCLIKLPTNRCLFVTFALKKIWCLFTQQTRVFPHSNIFHCIPQTLTFRGNIWSPRSGTNLQSKVRAIKWPQTICHLKIYIYIYLNISQTQSLCPQTLSCSTLFKSKARCKVTSVSIWLFEMTRNQLNTQIKYTRQSLTQSQ